MFNLTESILGDAITDPLVSIILLEEDRGDNYDQPLRQIYRGFTGTPEDEKVLNG
jgi:hypothetical protein